MYIQVYVSVTNLDNWMSLLSLFSQGTRKAYIVSRKPLNLLSCFYALITRVLFFFFHGGGKTVVFFLGFKGAHKQNDHCLMSFYLVAPNLYENTWRTLKIWRGEVTFSQRRSVLETWIVEPKGGLRIHLLWSPHFTDEETEAKRDNLFGLQS